jgi:iron complex outermembrane receptor protein
MSAMTGFIHRLTRLAFATCLAAGGVAAMPALDPLNLYAIPAGTLDGALRRWAEQSGTQLIYAPELVEWRATRGLNGRYSSSDALAELVRESGLEGEATGTATWILKRTQRAVLAQVEAPELLEPVGPPPRPLAAVSVYSRPLLRMAAESSMPVTTITRSEIEASGYLTLFELLKAQPGVQVTSRPERMSGNSGASFETGASGAASVALRRLGPKATLLLVDGRRMTTYGLASDATGSVADTTTIPLAMVERIDILRDGAATLYGADAMAGVIDISLRRNFDGREASVLLGASSRGDTIHRQATTTLGKHYAGGGNAVLVLDAVERDPLAGNERGWYSLDRRAEGLLDARSVYSFPGNAVTGPDGLPVLMSRRGCRSDDLDEAGVCRDDRAQATSLNVGRQGASVRNYVYLPLDSGIDAFVDVRVTKTVLRQESAPTSATILIPDDDDPSQSQQVLHAFWDVGPVRQSTSSTLFRVDLGLSGTRGSWNWDVGVDAERSRVDDDISGLVNRLGFERVARDGYRFDQRPAPGDVADVLAPRVTNEGQSSSASARATASTELDVWGSHVLRMDTGIEVRREAIRLQPDDSLVSGELLIAPPVPPFSASRASFAWYSHVDVPFSAGISADLGLRFEQIQQHGRFAAPAVGLRWAATPSVLLRAGIASGRRVPTLLEQRGLDASGMESRFEYVDVPNELLPCALGSSGQPNRCLLQLRPVEGPALQAERSRSVHAGVIWEPTPRFNLALDFYQLERRGEIALIPVDFALQHPAAFPGFLSHDEQGRLDALNLYRVNLGRTTTRGLDIDVRWNVDSGDYGVFTFAVGANHVGELRARAAAETPAMQRAGYADEPQWTGVGSLRWANHDWSTTAGVRYTGSQAFARHADDPSVCPAYAAALGKCSTPSFFLANLNVAYAGWASWRVAINVANLFDHTPRYFRESSGGYNPLFDDAVGRYFTLSATYRF